MEHTERDIDWTGVKPDQSPIAPLDFTTVAADFVSYRS
jgi:hypothetical protein